MNPLHEHYLHEHFRHTREQIDALSLPADMSTQFLAPEAGLVDGLLEELSAYPVDQDAIARRALRLAEQARAFSRKRIGVDSFLQEYSLGSEEGVVLMCLAEALIRIPDDDTAMRLVEDRLEHGDWETHLGRSDSVLVNASTWGLLLTGRIFQLNSQPLAGRMKRVVGRLGREVALRAIRQAMTIVGQRFVVSESIKSALRTVGPFRHHDADARHAQTRYSFDMLGEAALADDDAEAYFTSYQKAIEAIGAHYHDAPTGVPAISIKLSALEPRFEPHQIELARRRLRHRVEQLLRTARDLDVQITIDAEEAYRHQLMLAVFSDLSDTSAARGWDGFGLAIQGYQKRAPATVAWLAALARHRGTRIPVRLVKGAYWDTEIKRAQQLGLDDYPVYVRKPATDVSFLVCAHRILAAGDALYGQFATHNAHTLAAVLQFAQHHGNDAFEVQRLFGMGEGLAQILRDDHPTVPQRVYAPVGPYKALLPYLMRRLLENGANSSFVHHISDERRDISELIADPAPELAAQRGQPLPVPLPGELYAPDRDNSPGLNLEDLPVRATTLEHIQQALAEPFDATSLVPDRVAGADAQPVVSPAATSHRLGSVRFATEADAAAAMAAAHDAFDGWRLRPVDDRAQLIEALGEALLADRETLLGLLLCEAGKGLGAADAELREAVDFCRYYALLARRELPVRTQPGPTGERNRFSHDGRGPFICIAPWNFPLAIFTGQVVAALVAGNPVIAKPSEMTNLIAHRVVTLAHQVGIPPDVLCLLLGPGQSVLPPLLTDPRLGGVAFTGSTRTAQIIHRTLAERTHGFVPFIAETGGINAMLVDSSALVEQVVRDIMTSAFDGAGQRCSALRVVFLQREIADEVLRVLKGALALWRIGHPYALATDMGPLITSDAARGIEDYIAGFDAAVVHRPAGDLPGEPGGLSGHYVRPAVIELDGLRMPEREVFGPVLHVVRYDAGDFDAVLGIIRSAGYTLTLGLHSRIEDRAEDVARLLPVGNFYVNRSIIAATVETQPFGGFGLSGTGPKAGGPDYLRPFTIERTITINTTAVGGDTELLSGHTRPVPPP